jgi:hypothetical protein
MIIDGLHLYTATGAYSDAEEVAQLSLNHADLTHSYILQEGWGFDVDEVTPQFYGGYEEDNFYEMTLKERLIVLKIRFKPSVG